MLTTKQAAEILNVSLATVKRLAASNKIKAEKLGRDWLIDEKSLRNHAKSQQSAKS